MNRFSQIINWLIVIVVGRRCRADAKRSTSIHWLKWLKHVRSSLKVVIKRLQEQTPLCYCGILGSFPIHSLCSTRQLWYELMNFQLTNFSLSIQGRWIWRSFVWQCIIAKAYIQHLREDWFISACLNPNGNKLLISFH